MQSVFSHTFWLISEHDCTTVKFEFVVFIVRLLLLHVCGKVRTGSRERDWYL
ncbi:hypothetical protein M404DRAFT_1004686 [Pisolithus tinctorius Marx 270]|uniref:Uncharacterized protein n=1 Tax=Pisolithus tinctorius Marx 270 TaxID=870435 RepID=A0A0C3NW61_PISTI|nr:hypothetical protein M404DRAFT_1004686 [Pisolithus tinctorius Marx 270]